MPRVIERLRLHAWAARRVEARYVLVSGSLARRGCGRDVDLAVKLGRRPLGL